MSSISSSLPYYLQTSHPIDASPLLFHRRYSSVTDSLTKPDNISATTTKALDSFKETNETPLEVTPQGYYAQGYSLMGFHQNNPFQSALGSSTGVGSGSAEVTQEKDIVPSSSGARTRSEGTFSKTNTATSPNPTSIAIESKKSESPEDPPNTQRKNVNPEFFMEEEVVPPSPTNKLRHTKHQQIQREQQALKEQQPKLQQHHHQQQHANHEDYDNPNHLYAEINVKHRAQPITRQGSEGTASLAMTSISSITGHGSLFAKDHDNNTGGLSPLPGGLWRIGSTIINTSTNNNAAVEENYFDYSNDETLKDHRRENSGILERMGNAVVHIFYTTCQCFEVNSREPMSSGVVTKEDLQVDTATKTLNEAIGNGTSTAVSREPMFSSPMEG